MAVDTLDLNKRLERIEQSLNRITSALDQAPGLMSIATDSIDSMFEENKKTGGDGDAQLRRGINLLARLTDPKIQNSLHQMLDLIEQGPGLSAMAVDSMDEMIYNLNISNESFQERIEATSGLLLKLSSSKQIAKMEQLLEMADRLPGIVAMIIDSIDRIMNDHGEIISDMLAFLNKENLLFLKQVADSLTEAQEQQSEKMGILGVMKAMRDPDRQRTMGFLMNVTKNLGNNL